MHSLYPIFVPPGYWANMDVAVKMMLFQNSTQRVSAPHDAAEDLKNSARKRLDTRQLVLREAAVCCTMSHPNVVATYHYEVLQATAFRDTPSGLSITDKPGEEAFKLYLIQVGKPNLPGVAAFDTAPASAPHAPPVSHPHSNRTVCARVLLAAPHMVCPDHAGLTFLLLSAAARSCVKPT